MSRRASSLGLPIIPEDKPSIEYQHSSGKTYVVQHLYVLHCLLITSLADTSFSRGNAVVVRRTSSGGLPAEGRRSSLITQHWERRASTDPSMPTSLTSAPSWSAAPSVAIRRGSAKLSPIQLLPPPSALSAGSISSSPHQIRRGSYQAPQFPRTGSVSGSIHGSINEEDEDVDVMDVDLVASPCSSAFSSPASSPMMAPPIAQARPRQQPQQLHVPASPTAPRSPLRSKVASWLRNV
jgi:hypothetical protein